MGPMVRSRFVLLEAFLGVVIPNTITVKRILSPVFEKNTSGSIIYKIRTVRHFRDKVDVWSRHLLSTYLLVLTQGYFELNNYDFKLNIYKNGQHLIRRRKLKKTGKFLHFGKDRVSDMFLCIVRFKLGGCGQELTLRGTPTTCSTKNTNTDKYGKT